MFHHCAADDWRGRILLTKRRALLQRAPGKTTPPTGAETVRTQGNSKTRSKYDHLIVSRPAHPEDSSDDNDSSVSGVLNPEIPVSPQTVRYGEVLGKDIEWNI